MTAEPTTLDAFVLCRSQRDAGPHKRLLLEYWLATPVGPVRVRLDGTANGKSSAVFFVGRGTPTRTGRRREVQLTASDGRAVDAIYFDTLRDLRDERDRLLRSGLAVYEGDVLPSERHLMERFITGACRATGVLAQRDGFLELTRAELREGSYTPQLRAASIDIETDGFDGPVLSIALVCDSDERVYMRRDPGSAPDPSPPAAGTTYLGSEADVIRAFCAAIRALDPDLLLGWNVIEFDLAVLQRRAEALGITLPLGRDGSGVSFTSGTPMRARIAGRVALDGIGSLRAASHLLESYALQDVAERFLGRGKAIAEPHGDRVAEIRRMFAEDRPALARYNLADCHLARDVFTHLDLVGFLVERARLTGLALDRVRGAVAAFDYVYLPRLHRAGFVAPTVGPAPESAGSPGGYVLDSVPGLYDNVIVLDFKSLYPSIIRTFCIDPLALWVARSLPSEDPAAVSGFAGARFDRNRHILPQLITQLWQSRDDAKRRNDAARSYAIKILMNSFYGVLGTPACRFFDPKLASSITLRGHEIITQSRGFLAQRGYRVIYGDTDSLFVHLPSELAPDACEATGQQLAEALNQHWRERVATVHALESQLDVEYDTHYLRFFMPTLRDSSQGSKKRYAGLTRSGVEFTGLEAVRTDWTPLARRFQRELYRRVFENEPYVTWLREQVALLFAGQLDRELVYKKRLRRELDAYVKNVPPHVRAARQLEAPTRDIAYVVTVRGPAPAHGTGSAALDYRHYLERQLAPAADNLLQHLGTSLAELIDRQLSLF
ncbi:MAG: DNA polymerase II [Polyangiales bacterium]